MTSPPGLNKVRVGVSLWVHVCSRRTGRQSPWLSLIFPKLAPAGSGLSQLQGVLCSRAYPWLSLYVAMCFSPSETQQVCITRPLLKGLGDAGWKCNANFHKSAHLEGDQLRQDLNLWLTPEGCSPLSVLTEGPHPLGARVRYWGTPLRASFTPGCCCACAQLP